MDRAETQRQGRQGAVWEAGKPGGRMERRNLGTSKPEDCLVPWSPYTDGKTKIQGGEELARCRAPFHRQDQNEVTGDQAGGMKGPQNQPGGGGRLFGGSQSPIAFLVCELEPGGRRHLQSWLPFELTFRLCTLIAPSIFHPTGSGGLVGGVSVVQKEPRAQ